MQNKMLFFTVLCSMLTASFMFTQENSELFKAVECNNLTLVKKLIKRGISLNDLNKDKKTALDVAVERRNHKIARYLLQHGAQVAKCQNAVLLDNYLKRRAIGFFVCGWFFTPFLWIGGGLALANRSLIQVL